MTRTKATVVGLGAIAAWSTLALLTVASAPVPPFQLNAMCFALAGFVGLIWAWRAEKGLGFLREVPIAAYALGIAGLFGYHAFYFGALRLAPPAQAGLIAYLWPLLIVLFSGLLPGEVLRRGHVVGAGLAFGGAALILAGSGAAAQTGAMAGYALAVLCALTWSGYSVLSRRFAQVPTGAVAVYCIVSAGLSVILHMALETTAWPEFPVGWAAVLGLGLGPVGLAFFLWDVGMKRGDIQILGVASYAAPLASTLILVVTGFAELSLGLGLAAILLTAGAALAARASARTD
ncbi:membrane protein [Actibacterium mucosum KCTC 23349]|uniref:Membrane protein n=1 Tax=Actibacterium mucosum KCTC 23349 TaxID=1454373 RepID=A0A037ZI33_9RHOB|nr:DMT family transporter [Actibacterium mucosum]KAJ56110.1 membrane protein [Actibacterium mucosum KCTC 23349]